MIERRASLLRVLAVMGREFLDLRHNPRLWVSVYLIPVLMSVLAIPSMSRIVDSVSHAHAPAVHALVGQAPVSRAPVPISPQRGRLTPLALAMAPLRGHPRRVSAFLIVGQFMSYLFMFALFQPLALGAQAIVAEKQEATLEPLLATPLETWELLLGKALFVVVPATLLTWVMYGLQLLGAMTVLPRGLVLVAFASGTWRLAIFALAPLMALFITLMLVAISARVSDPRTAQQLGALLILPMLAAGLSSVTGIVSFAGLVRAAIAVLALACALLLAVAVRAFQRETILTRWG